MPAPGSHVRPRLSPLQRRLTDVAGYAAGAPFAIAAALRGGKAFHPEGVVHEATLVVPERPAGPLGARLLREPGEHHGLVRFSRAIGLPRPLPDLLGMSIRLPDVYGPGRHQDFLLVTSADLPVIHHGFLPAADVQQRPYTSSLPYRAAGKRFLIGALPDPASPRPSGGDELDRLARAAASGRLRFHLAVAPVLGRFRPVAELRVGARLPAELDALQFTPFNTGGGLEPAGLLNRLRDYAYPMSQSGWRRRQGRMAAPADSASSRSTSAADSGVAR